MLLKRTYTTLLSRYATDEKTVDALWDEIEAHYSATGRYYHTLAHLHDMLIELQKVKHKLSDWESILFALYYHDVIYNPLRSDNEERSAELAGERMRQLTVSASITEQSKILILATKNHYKSIDVNINYFIDADLAILGQSWQKYFGYAQNMRREYSTYSDVIYNHGRKQVLTHFLGMEWIFKTADFQARFEKQARANLKQELKCL